MSSATIAKEKAALAQEEGKLKKLIAAIKKFFAKEFLWVLFVLLLGLPIGLIITYIIETYGSEKIMEMINKLLNGKPLFIGAYAVSLAGIYFTRTVVGAINLMANKPKS
ncbi:MAG: hypothetical protein COA31_009080 [Flavobacteriales bacterium]|jgi:uncharacterized membrane protein|nr:hypothetical protein [Flavobacteriales bacterium]|tara:strand:- start:41544 stop:41870 length:327 start_codon:yes stop_codon:yes gene_type:complete